MPDRPTVEERLTQLRDLVLHARAVPLSGSCVVNREELLAAIDGVVDGLPAEVGDARQVLARCADTIAAGEAEAERLVSEAVRTAEEIAAKVRADAEHEAEALRRETDRFVDARMAGFEAALDETASQVRTARARLAERSDLHPDGARADGAGA